MTDGRAPALALMLAVLVPATSGTACTAAQREANTYRLQQAKVERTKKAITERAQEYWSAVRWRDWVKAAAAMEREADRVAFLTGHKERDDAASTIDGIQVRFVVLDDTLERAEVHLSFTRVGPPDFRMSIHEESQLWYKRFSEWWLVPTSQVADQGAAR